MAIKEFKDEYRFLSNFWPCQIEYEGIQYACTETAYQASKSLFFNIKTEISKMKPGAAKRYARTVALRPDWEQVKLKVMEDVVRLKFNSSQNLKELLLITGDQELIEGNTWNDTFWGVCRGKGENHLGKILMKVRTELQIDDVFDCLKHNGA